MMAWLAFFGLAAVLVIAIGVGAALDTEAQRRESSRLAAERRARTAHDRLRLCDECPFRDLD